MFLTLQPIGGIVQVTLANVGVIVLVVIRNRRKAVFTGSR
jgi:hypothetical protein